MTVFETFLNITISKFVSNELFYLLEHAPIDTVSMNQYFLIT